MMQYSCLWSLPLVLIVLISIKIVSAGWIVAPQSSSRGMFGQSCCRNFPSYAYWTSKFQDLQSYKTISSRSSLRNAARAGTETELQQPQEKQASLSHVEFQEWFKLELRNYCNPELYELYPVVMEAAPKCVTNWRRRYDGDPVLWKRLFTLDRVLKEIVEAVPIIHAVSEWIQHDEGNDSDLPTASPRRTNVTIVDLCSGKGYLSMFLSEYLPAERVQKFILMDKAWPRCHGVPQPHHMSWDHIYGYHPSNPANLTDSTLTIGGGSTEVDSVPATQCYFDTWPIPLHTSKQDLKKSSTHRQLQKRLFDVTLHQDDAGPIIMLAVHLCGTLSLRAIEMFNRQPETIKFLALKPCCLPAIQLQEETFVLGRHNHTFNGIDVCAPGKWSRKTWYGPPRWHLESKFDTWVQNLFMGINNDDFESDDNTNFMLLQKGVRHVRVQTKGGYQNSFIFAERQPTTPSLWEDSTQSSRHRHRRIQVRKKPKSDRRSKHYWLDIENVESELRQFWESVNVTIRNDEPPPIPNETLLNYLERFDIRGAIVVNGGRKDLALLLGGARIMPGKWKDAVAMSPELQQLVNKNGTSQNFLLLSPDVPPPSPQQLRQTKDSAAQPQSGTNLDISDASDTETGQEISRWSHKAGRNRRGHWSRGLVIQELYV